MKLGILVVVPNVINHANFHYDWVICYCASSGQKNGVLPLKCIMALTTLPCTTVLTSDNTVLLDRFLNSIHVFIVSCVTKLQRTNDLQRESSQLPLPPSSYKISVLGLSIAVHYRPTRPDQSIWNR
jgi:hypothetical protein